MNGGNLDVYAPIRDIIIQTYGITKSVHIIYPFFPLRRSELDHGTKFDKSLTKKTSLAEDDLKNLHSDLDFLLFGESQLLFRPLSRVRTDSYFGIKYTWLYQKWKNWNPFLYEITKSEDNDGAVQLAENSIASSSEKTIQSKLLIQNLSCKNFQKYI